MTAVETPTGWTRGEMLAVAASAEIRDGEVAVIGLGLPQISALLARYGHAPGARLLLEIGVFEPSPRTPAMGIADPAIWQGARAFGGMLDVLGYMLHGGRVDVGVLGALQVDADGSVNTTMVRGPDGVPRRFNGSGGGNDIASLAGRTLVVIRHDPRKLAANVEFLTSPGVRVRGRPRAEAGLPGAGTAAVVTDRAVIRIVDSGALLASVHPGETVDSVLAATPLPVAQPPGGVTTTAAPTPEQLALIRTELDPHGWYTRYPTG